MAHERFPLLLSPIRVGPLSLRNRLVWAAHGAGLAGKDYMPTEDQVGYFAERARGGVGLIVIGASHVMTNSIGFAFRNLVRDPRCIPGLRAIGDAVHTHGTRVMVQLVHQGRQGTSELTMEPLWAPSALPDTKGREVPKEMEPEDFDELVEHYVASARIAQEAGLDGVEVYAGHGYLLSEILSPHSNRRTDAYGSTQAQRTGFVIRILRSVREAVGADFVVGFRMNGDDLTEGGLTSDDAVRVARDVDAAGLADYIHVTAGTYNHETFIADNTQPPGPYVPYAAKIKRAVRAPVMAVNRITTPEQAEAILASGAADLIGMVRALVADPFLPRKAAEGRADDIRVCISCNQVCVQRIRRGLPIGCIYNPTAGEEQRFPESSLQKAAQRRRVLVVGGGPAGLEAARTGALRGHEVTLLEKGDEIGGQVAMFAREDSSASAFAQIARYYRLQLKQLGVDVRLGVAATPALVKAHAADAVIVATGSEPDRSGYVPARPNRLSLPGVDQDHVLTAWDVLLQRRPVGKRVVVYDEQSGPYTESVVEFLVRRGHEVTIVTRLPQFGLNTPAPNLGSQLRRLHSAGVRFRTLALVREILPRALVLEHAVTGAEEVCDGVDTVVLALYHRASAALYHALKGSGVALSRVGDAVAPRGIHAAVYEAHRLARML